MKEKILADFQICISVPFTLAFNKEVLYETFASSVVVLSNKKWYLNFLKKGFSFSENLFQN